MKAGHMSTRHPSAIAILAVCLLSPTAGAEHAETRVESRAVERVPSYVVAAARRAPLELAYALAEESVPTGIEIRESDVAVHARVSHGEGDRTVTLSAVAQAFNEHHREYRASVSDGVFVIRLADSIPRFLDEPSTLVNPVVVTGVMDAERAIFAQLDPRLRGPAIGGGIGAVAGAGLRARVSLDGRGKSVAQTLNEIVRQVPGAWQVTTFQVGREWRVAAFGFIYPDRSSSTHTLAR
jgi:hypothetical protein